MKSKEVNMEVEKIKGVNNAVKLIDTIHFRDVLAGRRYFDVTGHIKYPGFVDAYVENAAFHIVFIKKSERHKHPGCFQFLSGIWKSGVWENGTWCDGIWLDGEWQQGKIRSIYEDEIDEVLDFQACQYSTDCINPGEAHKAQDFSDRELRSYYRKVEKEVEDILGKGEDPRENIICDSTHYFKAAIAADVLKQKMLFDWSEDMLNKIKHNYIEKQTQIIEELKTNKNRLFQAYSRIE